MRHFQVTNVWERINRERDITVAPCVGSRTEPGQATSIAQMVESFRQGTPVEAKPHFYDVLDDTLDDATLASMAPIDEPDPLIKAQYYKDQYDASQANLQEKARQDKEKKSRAKVAAIQQLQSQRAGVVQPTTPATAQA